MASENMKIIINEEDLTKPGGSGIAPSDIAFVPGFSVLDEAPRNIPTLCNDYLEFERTFGTVPKILTTRDMHHEDKDNPEDYTKYGFYSGCFDASYIYAKELLLQGMPVIYSNLTPDVSSDTDPFSLDPHKIQISEDDEFDTDKLIYSSSVTNDWITPSYDELNKVIILEQVASKSSTITIRCKYDSQLPTMNDNQPSITTFDIHSIVDSYSYGFSKVKKVKISPSNVHPGSEYVRLSDSQLEFTNTTDDVIVELFVDVVVSIDAIDERITEDNPNIIKLNVFEYEGSCLDAFYQATGEDVTDVKGQLDLVKDKSIYSVKYITSGGYPSVVKSSDPNNSDEAIIKFADRMIKAASERGDAVALIDYQRDAEELSFGKVDSGTTFYARMQEAFNGSEDAEYGAAFYPWGVYSCGSSLSNVSGLDSDDVYMPPSFAYMLCLAKAIKTSPNWLAMAGVSRGIVPKLNTLCTPNNVLSNTIAEEMQPKFGLEGHKLSINCITNIRPYGLTLWGNRTMKEMNREGSVALNFLNIRNMLSDIKKVLYSTAKSLMFEQNSDTLWLRFKAGVTPLLNQLKTGEGIADFKIVKLTTKYDGNPLQKGELAAVVKIYPLYAIEYFELTVEINDQDVVVN